MSVESASGRSAGGPFASVCNRCGAMVVIGWEQVHANWHHENDHDHRDEQD